MASVRDTLFRKYCQHAYSYHSVPPFVSDSMMWPTMFPTIIASHTSAKYFYRDTDSIADDATLIMIGVAGSGKTRFVQIMRDLGQLQTSKQDQL